MISLALILALVQDPVGSVAKAPELKLDHWKNTDGRIVSLRDYRGKVVLLHVSPGLCCGYDFSAKIAKKALEKFGSKGLVVVGVTGPWDADFPRQWAEVQSSVKITWPVGFDSSGQTVSKIYPGDEVQYSFCFVDRKGNLRKFKLSKLEDVYPLAEQLVAEKAD